MKIRIILATALIALPMTVFAQTTTASTNPGILPDSPLYFLDRIGEFFQELFTFNPDAKARLELKFASERLAEIKALLSTKGAGAKGLDVAEGRLHDSLNKASDIVQGEKNRGRDVSELAKELKDKVDAENSALNEFNGPDKDELKSEKSDLEDASDELSKQMDMKSQAEEAVNEADQKRAELNTEAADKGVTLTQDLLGSADVLIANAKDELAKGNYEAVYRLAENAVKAIEQASEKIDQETESATGTNEHGDRGEERRRGYEGATGTSDDRGGKGRDGGGSTEQPESGD